MEERKSIPICAAATKVKNMRIVFVVRSKKSLFAVQTCQQLLDLANQFVERNYYQAEVTSNLHIALARDTTCSKKTVILFENNNSVWTLHEDEKKLLRVRLPGLCRVGLVGTTALISSSIPCLKRRTVCVHPDFANVAIETDMNVQASCGAAVRDGPVFSAISGLAALKMIGMMIAEDLGEYTARRVLEIAGLIDSDFDGHSVFVGRYFRRAADNTTLKDALTIMIDNIEQPLPARTISDSLSTSPRHLERLFHLAFGDSPMRTYRFLRLERAHQLLRHSDLPMLEVSLACGFGSVQLLTRWYRDRYDLTPKQSRERRYQGQSWSDEQLFDL